MGKLRFNAKKYRSGTSTVITLRITNGIEMKVGKNTCFLVADTNPSKTKALPHRVWGVRQAISSDTESMVQVE